MDALVRKATSSDGGGSTATGPMLARRKSRLPGSLMGAGGGTGSQHAQANTFDAVAGIQYKLMSRRLSTLRRPSIAPSSKTDQSLQQVVKLENTYRLVPAEHERFSSAAVERVTRGILESFLSGEKYGAQKCARLTQQLCDVIKARVREMHIPRYKVVCHVLIGQDRGQCIITSSRCIWDTETDNSATASYKNGSLFAVATIYGLYYE